MLRSSSISSTRDAEASEREFGFANTVDFALVCARWYEANSHSNVASRNWRSKPATLGGDAPLTVVRQNVMAVHGS
jgi:hypothetical protein